MSSQQPSARQRVVVAAIVVAVIAVLVAAAAGVFAPDAGDDQTSPSSTTVATGVDPGTPTTTPAPTVPTVPTDPVVAAGIDELEAYVAAARGLEFINEVAVQLAADTEFEALIDVHFLIDPVAIAAQAAYYEALGLIPEGSAATYALELRERYRASLLGFYDYDTGLLVVRGTELDGGVRRVIVHELVHALDDQWFELSRPEYATDNTAEHASTLEMVSEGDAVRIENQWIDAQPADVQEEARRHAGENPSGPVTSFGDFVDFDIDVPYQAGGAFVTRLAASGGERLVDAVLIDPPETTEQVLYPEVFDRREGRIRVPRPPASGPIIDEGVVGALFWTGLLGLEASGVPDDLAAAALDGWGGDWQVSWAENGQTCTRVDLVGDTDADTAELLEALTLWVATRPRISVGEADGRVRMELCYVVPAVGDVVR